MARVIGGNNNASRRKVKEGRMLIVAELYKKGYSVKKIADEVKQRMNTTCSTRTVWNDINTLLKEWRETRIEDMDLRLQYELECIDDNICELWKQWEKSKEDYTKQYNKRVGVPMPQDASSEGNEQGGGNNEIVTIRREQSEQNEVGLGDPRYIAEIRQQQMERRKLLGIYSPEKREVTGKDGKDLVADPIMIEIIDSRSKVDAKDTDN